MTNLNQSNSSSFSTTIEREKFLQHKFFFSYFFGSKFFSFAAKNCSFFDSENSFPSSLEARNSLLVFLGGYLFFLVNNNSLLWRTLFSVQWPIFSLRTFFQIADEMFKHFFCVFPPSSHSF